MIYMHIKDSLKIVNNFLEIKSLFTSELKNITSENIKLINIDIIESIEFDKYEKGCKCNIQTKYKTFELNLDIFEEELYQSILSLIK